MKAPSDKYDIFLSYSMRDVSSVEQVARFLSDVGVKVWFAEWLLSPGQAWGRQLELALASSRTVAFFVGSAPLGGHQQAELRASLSERKVIVPVLLPGASWENVPPALRGLTAVDLRTGLDNTRELNRIIAAVDHSGQIDLTTRETRIGDDLRRSGDLAGALAHYERAVRVAEAVYGESHPLVASLLNSVAVTQREAGRLSDALENLERALQIDSESYGPEDATVARDSGNIGSVLADLGRLDEARAYLERALRIDEQTVGPDHPDVVGRLHNLANLLHARGELEAARQAYERVLAMWEKALGPDHPNVATAMNNLGAVLQDLGDLPAARRAFESALRIDEAAFGPDHPNVARDVNNLGSVLHDLGDLPAARQAFERALRIDEAAFGPDHPNVARDVNNLGSVLLDLGDLPAARQAFERALRIDEATFGPEHPNVATDVNNLGRVLQDLGDLPAARQAYERALGMLEQQLGPEHPKVATVLGNLAGAMVGLGEQVDAIERYQRAYELLLRTLGPEHPSTAAVRAGLSAVLAQAERQHSRSCDASTAEPETRRRVFIIAGRDEVLLLRLERLLRERWNLQPVVLRYVPTAGMTLMERFERQAAKTSFAFALLTPDDLAPESDTAYSPASRNLLFQLGWFYGHLGRNRVCILLKKGTEVPSDLIGIERTEFVESVEEKAIEMEDMLRVAGLLG